MLKHEERLEGVDERLCSVVRAASQGTDIMVLQGLRTQAEQDAALASGHSQRRHSKHQDGKAVDLMPLNAEGQPVGWKDHAPFRVLAHWMLTVAHSLDVDIRWGGTWRSTAEEDVKDAAFYDGPHFELES